MHDMRIGALSFSDDDARSHSLTLLVDDASRSFLYADSLIIVGRCVLHFEQDMSSVHASELKKEGDRGN